MILTAVQKQDWGGIRKKAGRLIDYRLLQWPKREMTNTKFVVVEVM